MRFSWLLFFTLLSLSCSATRSDRTGTGNAEGDGPRLLIVTAHPDDESGMAATIFKLTHAHDAVADLALVTNGEGGYKYSSLGNIIYGLELTDERVGRKELPAIRKNELVEGGNIIGLRHYFFLEQQDHRYTLDVDSTFSEVWDTARVTDRLVEIMQEGSYDYVFGLLPTPGTHGHHKGATILALRAAARLAPSKRPVVLGVSVSSEGDSVEPFTGLPGYPMTTISSGLPSFEFDRRASFGYKNRLDYQMVVNWLIAAHKSQGTMQLGMNRGDREEFWWFDVNDRTEFDRTTALFRQLASPMFEELEY